MTALLRLIFSHFRGRKDMDFLDMDVAICIITKKWVQPITATPKCMVETADSNHIFNILLVTIPPSVMTFTT